ncbi:tripartite tricarboxylate transporter substrate binding protein [Georgenia sp. Z1491]|uniref:tripartite tricarboxylate transporter substrate binding protein n=1 Tax=Georgenia sp. Z1491 TaxID=3416707 RepID=UPI003CE8577B
MNRPTKTAAPLLAGALLLAACGGGGGDAADYPEQPIDYVVAFDAGGESDITARLQQNPLAEALGVDITVSNQPGGGGALAWSELTRTAPDGYTVMGHNIPHIILQPMMRDDAGYETDDLEHVYFFQSTPNVLMVSADSEIETFADFVEEAQANPGTLSIGGSGDYSANHVGTLLLNDEAGIETTYTPFSGTGAATPALLGGHVDALMTYTPMIDQLGDQVRVLAVATEERLPQWEEYETFIENDVDLADGAYRGVAVPPETPQEIIDQLVAAFEEVNEDEELVSQFEQQGFVLENIGPDEARELIDERREVYTDLFERLGLL